MKHAHCTLQVTDEKRGEVLRFGGLQQLAHQQVIHGGRVKLHLSGGLGNGGGPPHVMHLVFAHRRGINAAVAVTAISSNKARGL